MARRQSPFRFTLVRGAPLLLVGCTASWGSFDSMPPPPGALTGQRGDAPACVRLSRGKEGAYRVPLAGAETAPELSALLAPVPEEVRRVIFAAGLEPTLTRLLRDRATLTPTELSARRQAIEVHLQSLRFQSDATIYEADCSGDSLEHLQNGLERSESARSIRWTILSIVTQAAAAIAIGALELRDAPTDALAVVGVSGGVAASALGAAAFLPTEHEVVLEHSHNLLAPIVTGTDPAHLYPSFVFRLLTLPVPDGLAPAEQLRASFERHLRDAVAADDLPRARALLFGGGGTYDARLIAARERMLDELEGALGALSRDLELLQRYLQRTLDAPAF